MNFKKSISIILSGVMAGNLTCSYIASAKAPETIECAECTECGECVTAEETPEYVVTKQETPKVVAISAPKESVQIPEHVVVKPETPKVIVINASKESAYNDREDRKQLIDNFISKNAKYLPKSKIRDLSAKLQKLSSDDIHKLSSVSLHKPSNMTLVSVFLGQWGIDRMIIGKVGTGILKFLTGGGFGIWWLIDIFKIGKLTKEQNWKNLKDEIKDL